eukprot:CAMPEP_0174271026 /NCGR_PEP_ID=MMETSP0439-20130205/46535_1 /TAXON_ID=0 /ORGANISM="Stereomyxa ramosa, Strain Chinc5" /LENGTH=824 /DNA_ID=CAMNT_0015360757 /DNA_START=380 /DNA_END=2851 /DNA_ORIENTATION=-
MRGNKRNIQFLFEIYDFDVDAQTKGSLLGRTPWIHAYEKKQFKKVIVFGSEESVGPGDKLQSWLYEPIFDYPVQCRASIISTTTVSSPPSTSHKETPSRVKHNSTTNNNICRDPPPPRVNKPTHQPNTTAGLTARQYDVQQLLNTQKSMQSLQNELVLLSQKFVQQLAVICSQAPLDAYTGNTTNSINNTTINPSYNISPYTMLPQLPMTNGFTYQSPSTNLLHQTNSLMSTHDVSVTQSIPNHLPQLNFTPSTYRPLSNGIASLNSTQSSLTMQNTQSIDSQDKKPQLNVNIMNTTTLSTPKHTSDLRPRSTQTSESSSVASMSSSTTTTKPETLPQSQPQAQTPTEKPPIQFQKPVFLPHPVKKIPKMSIAKLEEKLEPLLPLPIIPSPALSSSLKPSASKSTSTTLPHKTVVKPYTPTASLTSNLPFILKDVKAYPQLMTHDLPANAECSVFVSEKENGELPSWSMMLLKPKKALDVTPMKGGSLVKFPALQPGKYKVWVTGPFMNKFFYMYCKDPKDLETVMTNSNSSTLTPLHHACWEGKTEEVIRLTKLGASWKKECEGFSPLFIAMYCKHDEITRFFIDDWKRDCKIAKLIAKQKEPHLGFEKDDKQSAILGLVQLKDHKKPDEKRASSFSLPRGRPNFQLALEYILKNELAETSGVEELEITAQMRSFFETEVLSGDTLARIIGIVNSHLAGEKLKVKRCKKSAYDKNFKRAKWESLKALKLKEFNSLFMKNYDAVYYKTNNEGRFVQKTQNLRESFPILSPLIDRLGESFEHVVVNRKVDIGFLVFLLERSGFTEGAQLLKELLRVDLYPHKKKW